MFFGAGVGNLRPADWETGFQERRGTYVDQRTTEYVRNAYPCIFCRRFS